MKGITKFSFRLAGALFMVGGGVYAATVTYTGAPVNQIQFAHIAAVTMAVSIIYTLMICVFDNYDRIRSIYDHITGNLMLLVINMLGHRDTFKMISDYYQNLDGYTRDEIARIVSRPMNSDDAAHVRTLIDDALCDECHKAQAACKCDG